jgi:hypothetical protein
LMSPTICPCRESVLAFSVPGIAYSISAMQCCYPRQLLICKDQESPFAARAVATALTV